MWCVIDITYIFWVLISWILVSCSDYVFDFFIVCSVNHTQIAGFWNSFSLFLLKLYLKFIFKLYLGLIIFIVLVAGGGENARRTKEHILVSDLNFSVFFDTAKMC